MKKTPCNVPYAAPRADVRRIGFQQTLCTSVPEITLNQGESYSDEDNNGGFQW